MSECDRRVCCAPMLASSLVGLKILLCSLEGIRDAHPGGREGEVQEAECVQRGNQETRRSGGSCGEDTLQHDIDL